MNLSASAPSTMRWSNESEKYAQVRMAIVSSPSGPVRTFGRFSIAPMPRIADLRLVDDRRADERAEHARVGDRERPVLDFVRIEPLGARAIGEIVERARETGEREVVGVLDDGDDEPPVERDGDADVDLLAVDDLVAAHRRVERRECAFSPSTTALMMNGR